ncbi:hypothetical protein M6B38_312305 [Iris pallida]|uniref:Uncharacterized protein n=1 Tax=Iris pallida TaxID=29817 RepID=A0AAX6HHV1_IRIPA|nr:hypothetical protein M6B38_312305 [Iris pallida]
MWDSKPYHFSCAPVSCTTPQSHTLIVISNACYTDSLVHCSGSGTIVFIVIHVPQFYNPVFGTIVHIVVPFHAFQFTLFNASCQGCTLLSS